MKVLMLTHGPDMMGANRCMLDLIESLLAFGIKPVVALPARGKLNKFLEKRKVEYFVQPYFKWAYTKFISPSYWLHPIRALQNISALHSLVQKTRPLNFDLIYSNSSMIGIGAQLAEELNLPHIWHIREFGEKDYGQSFWRGRKYFRKWADKAAAVVSMSQAIHDEVLAEVSAPKFVLHDGIIKSEKLEEIPRKVREPSSNFTFLIIGLIHPTKGQRTALKAFHILNKSNPGHKLKIIGSGRKWYTRQLRKDISNLKLEDSVEMPGYVDNPYEVHQQSDALLMCSKSEGMGRVTLEGMIFCNPVIGFNGGATPELIADGIDGFIYQNGHEELAEKMKRLVEDPSLAFKMGQNGRDKIEAKYTLEIFGTKMFDIFSNAVKK